MSSIKIRWKSSTPTGMAREIQDAYRLRLRLMGDDGEGVTTPEALVAEEMADAMADEFERIHGCSYYSYA
ncbi:hypothetical protein [Streptomyces niveus]|uniref:hypothetical protein n=1 Tax=Streptomyces niveus TaxID=193462 RepID=UPI003450A7D0